MRIPGSRSTYRLPILSFWQQLRAGRLARRWLQLAAGLVVAALAIALMVEARLGLDPWNVLHEGLVKHLGISFGTVTIVSGIIVLVLWVPLRQPLGAGTIVNTLLIGGLIDIALWAVPTPEAWWARVLFLLVGVVLCGAGAAVYLGSHLGPGTAGRADDGACREDRSQHPPGAYRIRGVGAAGRVSVGRDGGNRDGAVRCHDRPADPVLFAPRRGAPRATGGGRGAGLQVGSCCTCDPSTHRLRGDQ